MIIFLNKSFLDVLLEVDFILKISKMYILNYPILIYIMIQEKSYANETELLFIIDIKLAAFISSIGHKTEIRLFLQDQYNM